MRREFAGIIVFILRNRNKVMAQNIRRMPQTHFISASLETGSSAGIWQPLNNAESGIQRYQCGHSMAGSKTSDHFGTAFLKTLIFQGFGGIIKRKNFRSSLHQFSPFSEAFFEG